MTALLQPHVNTWHQLYHRRRFNGGHGKGRKKATDTEGLLLARDQKPQDDAYCQDLSSSRSSDTKLRYVQEQLAEAEFKSEQR